MINGKQAVFIGGPHDGKGMLLGDETPAYLRLPVREQPVFSLVEVSAPLYLPSMQVARYYQEVVQFPVTSHVVLYTFDGTE